MSILQILQWVALGLTVVAGLISLVKPSAIYGFTGLTAPGARGVSEIRAVLGGMFIALEIAPLLLNAPVAYQVVGIGYLGIAAGRLVALVVDRSFEASNLVSLAFEVVSGVVLVL